MARIRIIKKNDEFNSEYDIGDIFEITGTWYGGVHITGKSGIPVSLDKDEYMELDTEPEPDDEENKEPDEENAEPGARRPGRRPGKGLQRGISGQATLCGILRGSGCPRRHQSISTRCLPLRSTRRRGSVW